MKKLIQADIRRVWKDKLFMISCIIGAAFAMIMPLLYKLIFSGLDAALDVMTESLIFAKSQFFAAFSPGNNFGLIVPVLLAIVLCKDFSFGTVRNKIISGNRRSSIFLSMYIVCFLFLWGIILMHALLTLVFSLAFFKYQPDPFTAGDFLYLLESLCFDFLLYLFIAAFVSWLCASMKNVGLVIVFYVAIVMVLSIVSAILQVSTAVLQYDPGSESTLKILDAIQRINIFNSVSYIGTGTAYTTKDVLYLTIPPIVGTAGFLFLGLTKFKRKDLK